MKAIFSFLFLLIGLLSNAQSNQKAEFNFSEITFHSSACNGVCPDISLLIDNERKVQLIRTVFQSKGVEDTAKSGGYKGILDEKQYDKLVSLLSKIKWSEVSFPDVKCCDKPVITIILYYNGGNKKLKSIEPAASTKDLISFLTDLGATMQLPKYDRPMDFEYVL